MKRLMISTVAIGLLALGGCSGMNTTEQRTLSGGAIGAAAGTVVSVATGGCIICGAAIGAGVGALGGFVYDRMER